jgi:hypothetical protein
VAAGGEEPQFEAAGMNRSDRETLRILHKQQTRTPRQMV